MKRGQVTTQVCRVATGKWTASWGGYRGRRGRRIWDRVSPRSRNPREGVEGDVVLDVNTFPKISGRGDIERGFILLRIVLACLPSPAEDLEHLAFGVFDAVRFVSGGVGGQ